MAIPALDESDEIEFEESILIARDFILMAYADTKKSLKQDFIGTSKNKRELKILAYNDSKNRFDEQAHVFEKEIIHIIPGDFKQVGELSYMICFKNEDTFQISHFDIITKNLESIGECDRIPMVISIDDWKPAVVLQLEDTTNIHFYDKGRFHSSAYSLPRFSLDHSSAYIDLNGDLRPDLAIVTDENDSKAIKILLWDDENGFKEIQTVEAPFLQGPLVFGDFRGKGVIDLGYLSKEDNRWYFNILLNTGEDHISNRLKIKRSKQRGFSRLGTPQPANSDKMVYMSSPYSDNINDRALKIDLESFFPGCTPISHTDVHHYKHIMPSGLMVADITLNRYPDVLILMKDRYGETTVKILKNCMETKGTFYPIKYQPPDISGLLSVSVNDYTDEYRESIVCSGISNGEYSLRIIPNPYATNRLRLTITVLQPNVPSRSFSSTVPGISCIYSVEDIGTVNLACSSSQTSHLHLQRPFCILGLGSMSYTGSMLSIGGPSTKTPKFYNEVMDIKNTILPNSDLVAFPDRNSLKVELYLSLGKHIFNIIGVLVVLLFINLLIVVFSVAREKRKTLQKRKKEVQNFNFDAL